MSQHEQRIFNYELTPEGRCLLHIPKGAELLGLIQKAGLPYLLALVDPDQPLEERLFRIVTTGEIFNPEILVFVGTIRLGGGSPEAAWYTMHVFEYETALIPKHSDPIHPRFQEDLKELKKEIDPDPLARLQEEADDAEQVHEVA